MSKYDVAYQVNEPDGHRQGVMEVEAPSEAGAKLACRAFLRADGSAWGIEILRVGATTKTKA